MRRGFCEGRQRLRDLGHGRAAASTTSATPSPSTASALKRFWRTAWGRKAEKRFLPMQPGDVPASYADIDDLKRDFGFDPITRVEVGVERFVRWYRDFFSSRRVPAAA